MRIVAGWFYRDSANLLRRWGRRMLALLLLVLIPNFVYAGLLYMPKPHQVVPAESLALAEKFLTGGEEEQLLLHMTQVMYEEMTDYIDHKRTTGDILQSTTLGIFAEDKAEADYVAGHLQGLKHQVIPVFSGDETEVNMVAIVKDDLEQAMELYARALRSRNPMRFRWMIRAQQMARELHLLLNAKVGERCHGVTTTWQMLKKVDD